MPTIRSLAWMLALATIAAAGSARAGQSEATGLKLDPAVLTLDATATAPTTDWTDAVKQPVSWLKWGADQRIRIEGFDNAITLDQQAPGHEWDFFRYRTRIWASISPCADFTMNARLIWEGRHWQNPTNNDEHSGAAYKNEWDNAQGVFDTLNFKLTVPQISTTFTVGRQDIALGEGWLVLDGTPLDGSTTIFFDAARSSTQFKDFQTTVDMIYINNYSSPDKWLPTINDTDRALIENDERGAILWITNKSIKNLEIDPYFIYKHDEKVTATGDNANIYTFGTRMVNDFTPNLRGRVEVAGQFGEKNNRTLGAWGLNSRLSYFFKDTMQNELRGNFEYLSGDKPGDSADQAFDPLWGRWPQWSELYVYTYAKETRIAQVTNLVRFGPGWVVHPTSQIELEFDYNALFAPENTRAGAAGFSSDGNFRGHLFSAIMRYKFNQHLSGHLWSEYLVPGNYQDDTRRDNAMFLRAELLLTF